jgi:hypothetical protein
LAALASGNPDPSTVSSTKIVDGVVHGAILFENGLHYVVNRLKQLGKTVGLPCRLTQYVVTRLRLCFGLAGQEKLVALARDVINLNLNFFSLSPFSNKIRRTLVRSGDPVIPETYGQLAGRIGAAPIRRSDECCRCRSCSSYELSS